MEIEAEGACKGISENFGGWPYLEGFEGALHVGLGGRTEVHSVSHAIQRPLLSYGGWCAVREKIDVV